MTSMLKAAEAKSDQLNYVDLGSNGERVLNVTAVTTNTGEQPVSVFYQGDNGKPWKPSKGMIRVLIDAYGDDDQNLVGKSILVYGDPTAKWAGKEVGGIRIKALSHIDKNGINVYVVENRKVRVKKHFAYFEPQQTQYVANATDQQWINAIAQDPNVINQIEDANYKAHIQNLLNSEVK